MLHFLPDCKIRVVISLEFLPSPSLYIFFDSYVIRLVYFMSVFSGLSSFTSPVGFNIC